MQAIGISASVSIPVRQHAVEGLGDVGARLAQNECRLQATLVTSFMVDAHRPILKATALLLRSYRKMELGTLIAKRNEPVIAGQRNARCVRLTDATHRQGVSTSEIP